MKAGQMQWGNAALAATLLSAAALGLASWNGWWIWRSQSWPRVQGRVVAAAVHPVGRSGPDEAEIRYTYVVDGRTYTAGRIGYLLPASQRQAHALAGRYGAGAQVEVRYDPASPSRATLRSDGGWRASVLLAVGACLAWLGSYCRRRGAAA